VREQAMRINARIAELANERMEILKAGAAGLGIDLVKNDYRVSDDWSFYERVVIPLPKQVRRARPTNRKAS
jgi:hypothetical protein